jgi:alcohol dehydrogenase (cytochrome c)
MATETEYVDAGEAVDFRNLSPGYIGSAPAVAKGVNYDRILKAREAEPHNWLTYYGAYDGQRYSLLDQINASNEYVEAPECMPTEPHWNTHSGFRSFTFEVLIWSSRL